MRDAIEYFFFSLLLRSIRIFTLPTVQKMGATFGRFVYSVIGYRKNLVLENLHHAFPEKSEKEIASIAQRSTELLFTTFFEILYLDKLSAEDITSRISFPDCDTINSILERGKGLIILTGHFGNWELNALAVPLFAPGRYTIIVQEQRNKFVDRFMTSMRSRFGTKLVYMKHAFRSGLTALRNNEVVALIADQSGPESGIYVDYFGRPASTHQGPAVFQIRSGAPMVLVMFIREPEGKMRMELEEIETDGIEGSEEDKMRIITERHVQALERFVRRYPDHWLWMHKRWKHTDKFLQRKQAEQE